MRTDVSWRLDPAPGELFRIIEIETSRGSLAIEMGATKGAFDFKRSAMGILSTLHMTR